MKRCEIRGKVEMFITEPDGTKKLIQRTSNFIAPTFLSKCAKNLIDDQDMIFDNMFVANTQPPTEGQDGMVFFQNSTTLFYSFITTKAHPTATTVVFTGTFTGTDVVIDSLQLGIGWVNLGTIHGFFLGDGYVLSNVHDGMGGWTKVTLGAAQTATINWTFEIV